MEQPGVVEELVAANNLLTLQLANSEARNALADCQIDRLIVERNALRLAVLKVSDLVKHVTG